MDSYDGPSAGGAEVHNSCAVRGGFHVRKQLFREVLRSEVVRVDYLHCLRIFHVV